MILSAQSIRTRCLATPPLLAPFVERGVSPGGRSFGLSSASYDVRIDQDVIVPPHGFVLASTVEHFNMPDDLAGTVRDKSSWARVGLAAQNTFLDPGWCGYLTVELSNHSDAEIWIAKNEPIAQIVFEILDQPTELPYRGKYYNQARGPQPTRHESERDDVEANRHHLEGLVGGRTRWREHIEQKDFKVLDIPWFKLPIDTRRRWWRRTKYNRRPPSAKFMAWLPRFLTHDQAKADKNKRARAAELAAGRALLSRAQQPPCEQCLRPWSPCQVRCLRSILEGNAPAACEADAHRVE
jgi:dCTP deaminase